MTRVANKMKRAEAEFMAACSAGATGATIGEFVTRFCSMFARQYDPATETQSNGRMRGYTYPAKKAVDLAVQEGIVDADGVDVGLILEPVTK